MPNHSLLHKSFVTRESDWPMAAMFLSYAFGRNNGLLQNVIRCQDPSPVLSWGSLQCVQPVRQSSSTCGTSIAVGCWQFPRPLITLCVCDVPFILSRVMFLLSFPVSLRKMANQRIDTGTLPYHIDRSSPFLDRYAATLG